MDAVQISGLTFFISVAIAWSINASCAGKGLPDRLVFAFIFAVIAVISFICVLVFLTINYFTK